MRAIVGAGKEVASHGDLGPPYPEPTWSHRRIAGRLAAPGISRFPSRMDPGRPGHPPAPGARDLVSAPAKRVIRCDFPSRDDLASKIETLTILYNETAKPCRRLPDDAVRQLAGRRGWLAGRRR